MTAQSFEPPQPGSHKPLGRVCILPSILKKSYNGKRRSDGYCEVWMEESRVRPIGDAAVSGSTRRSLPLRLDIKNHSATGFAWGYAGSGPAQLALALLMDSTGDSELAQTHYQDFKSEVVSQWADCWTISAKEIRDFVARQQSGNAP